MPSAFNNGIILQFGQNDFQTSVNQYVLIPISFTTKGYPCFSTANAVLTTGNYGLCGDCSITTLSFRFDRSDAFGSGKFKWLVIGY